MGNTTASVKVDGKTYRTLLRLKSKTGITITRLIARAVDGIAKSALGVNGVRL